MQRCLDEGTALPAHREAIVAQAFERGTVKTAAEREAEPPPQPPAAAPDSISDRQFAQQLAIVGVITEAEALAWAARGELPPALETAIGELPEADRFGARMLLSSATTYAFGHPLAAQLGELLGFDERARRALWTAAAAL